ncbi:type IX secretion system membrane protein PorP/SprF [Maribellus sp. CM-23]|uniref:PorP/SprF family type IX secretion system membrane protein n=1 Tax=Maribellus sp. CM-23 TaxID=2781026 RepID=UPI001F1F4FC4|nr:type IX secretion system membrane protein PorP/SprF [Maribellus sp. CM-23]MCE4565904.1 type IX secretion system membrane protein PorP/SprF [Maribellus sp. CM-23]
MKTKLNIIKALGILAIALTTFTSNAQQDPMYTQYMFNTQTINPAYAGTWESVGFMALARNQWTGWNGAPETFTFSLQAPLRNERVALGLNVIGDKVGMVKRFDISADYSYLVPISERTNLRLGLKGGFVNYTNNLQDYSIIDPNDPNFIGRISSVKPNFGVGAFLYSKRAYLGFSVPRVLNVKLDSDMQSAAVQAEIRHYFLIAGAVFDLGEDVKFKPTMLTKASFTSETGTPLQMDFSGNFLIKEKLWLGAMYRTGSSYGFIAQWIFDKKLRVGYAIDFATNNIKHHNNGTHEIMVSYELKFRKEEVVSPRYF